MREAIVKGVLWAAVGWLTLAAVKEVAYYEGRRGAAEVCACVADAAGAAYEATLPEAPPQDMGAEVYYISWSFNPEPMGPRYGVYLDGTGQLHLVSNGLDQVVLPLDVR